jgi:hypothetical protein
MGMNHSITTHYRQFEPEFADGVVFIPLASLENPALLDVTILEALGLKVSSEQPQQKLNEALREKQFERSVRLIGAIKNLHRNIGAETRTENQQKHERILNEARTHLGNAKLEQVQAEGENANLEIMIGYALREPEIRNRRSSDTVRTSSMLG